MPGQEHGFAGLSADQLLRLKNQAEAIGFKLQAYYSTWQRPLFASKVLNSACGNLGRHGITKPILIKFLEEKGYAVFRVSGNGREVLFPGKKYIEIENDSMSLQLIEAEEDHIRHREETLKMRQIIRNREDF